MTMPASSLRTAATSAAVPVPAPAAGPGRRPVVLVAGLVTVGALLTLALFVPGPRLPTPPGATANTTSITADRWERYTNTRYGVMVDYPADLFTPEPPPPDNAGRGFSAPGVKARFHIYSHANAFGASREELQAEDVLDLADGRAVRRSGTDGYVVIGVRDGVTIARRVLLSEGGALVHRLEIAYPAGAAEPFEPIAARMMRGFRVDPSIPEAAARSAGGRP